MIDSSFWSSSQILLSLAVEHSDHPRITADGAALLAELLSTQHSHGETLHNLSLNQQRIQDRGASLLFRAIPMSRLRTLSLSDNYLTDSCCPALRDLLFAPQANLEYLNLSKNRISDAGIRLIAPPLQSNRILAACDLSYNQISQVGFDLLLDALYSNPTMRTMSLHNNLSEDNSIEVFLKNRLVNTVRSHLEKTQGISDAIGNAEINEFLKSEGLMALPGGSLGIEEERPQDDMESLDSFGSSSKRCPLTSQFGSSAGYVPKMIRDRVMNSQESNDTLLSSETAEENKRFSHHVVASRMISDSSSNLGSFGKSFPSRAPREGSPMAKNPFQATAPAVPNSLSSSIEKQRGKSRSQMISLSRCPSSDLHLYSEEALMGCSFESTESSLRADSRELGDGLTSTSVVRPSQKLVMYRSLSSQGESREGKAPTVATSSLPATTAALAATLISKQDSFEFESCEDSFQNDDHSQYLILKQAPPPDQRLIAQKYRPSHELGKTTGVPHLASFPGAQPIRSATQRHRDSCNHLMYLQVLTPADPPGSQPYPVVMVPSLSPPILSSLMSKDWRRPQGNDEENQRLPTNSGIQTEETQCSAL